MMHSVSFVSCLDIKVGCYFYMPNNRATLLFLYVLKYLKLKKGHWYSLVLKKMRSQMAHSEVNHLLVHHHASSKFSQPGVHPPRETRSNSQ